MSRAWVSYTCLILLELRPAARWFLLASNREGRQVLAAAQDFSGREGRWCAEGRVKFMSCQWLGFLGLALLGALAVQLGSLVLTQLAVILAEQQLELLRAMLRCQLSALLATLMLTLIMAVVTLTVLAALQLYRANICRDAGQTCASRGVQPRDVAQTRLTSSASVMREKGLNAAEKALNAASGQREGGREGGKRRASSEKQCKKS